MSIAILKHLPNERTNIYTALEDIDFHWCMKEVEEFDRMWEEGLHISDIARAFGRNENEVAVLVIDRRMQNKIKPRPNGVYGRRMP